MHEQTRDSKVWKMLCAKLIGFARRMQRIGEQQQPGDKVWIFRAEHCGLAAAIGVSAEKDLSWDNSSQRRHGIVQSCAVALGISGERRSSVTLLAEGQIAAQNCVIAVDEGLSNCNQ